MTWLWQIFIPFIPFIIIAPGILTCGETLKFQPISSLTLMSMPLHYCHFDSIDQSLNKSNKQDTLSHEKETSNKNNSWISFYEAFYLTSTTFNLILFINFQISTEVNIWHPCFDLLWHYLDTFKIKEKQENINQGKSN